MLHLKNRGVLGVLLLSLTIAACAGGRDDADSEVAGQDLSASRPSHDDLQITFGSFAFLGSAVAGGTRTGTIAAGSHLGISYVRNFTDSGLLSAPTALEVDWTIDGGPVQTLAVTNQFAPTDGRIGISSGIDIPSTAAHELQLWFKFTSADGHVGFDSQDGKNYVASIIPSNAPVIRFDAPTGNDWPAPKVEGALTRGATLRFAYDFGRARALGRGGDDSFINVSGTAIFKDASGRVVATTGAHVASGSLSTAIAIPGAASRVEVFFVDTSHGSTSFDSNFGKNFGFDLQP